MTVEDERDVVAVLLRYATGIDRRDWALFRTCFASDFEADYGSFGRWRGPDEITAFMERAHAGLGATLHRMCNFVIAGDHEQASATSYVDALLMPGGDGGAPYRGIGFYDDRLVRTGEGWKLRSRRFVAVMVG